MMSQMPEVVPGLLLCDDLIFSSRITGTARALGLGIRPARSAEMLLELARQQVPRCVLVDLHNPGLVLADLMRKLAEVCSPMPRVVGYGSHVDTATLRAAREAGCDPVLPRSKFVEELPAALPGWLVGEGRPEGMHT
jgi:DNA-binding NarL/FixJ family response regulator